MARTVEPAYGLLECKQPFRLKEPGLRLFEPSDALRGAQAYVI
jgi:hypothetical protein